MTARRRAEPLSRRPFWGLLAALALLVQLAAPPGFMIAAGPAGPSLVVCTGHGAAYAPGQDNARHDRSAPRPDNIVCAFAGHAGPIAPPAPLVPPAAAVAYQAAEAAPLWDLQPARGLAAPPPPSQAPPLRL